MAKTKSQPKTTTLYSRNGTKVSVSEEQAEKLKKAGYSTSQPKS